jgi:transcriptional regulator with XRE-family HTH domain
MAPAEAYVISQDEFARRLGRLVAERRKEAGMSQKTFGEALSLSRASVANIESGRQAVSLYTVYCMADILKREPAELMPPATETGVHTKRSARESHVKPRLPGEHLGRLSFRERRQLEGLSPKESVWFNKITKARSE